LSVVALDDDDDVDDSNDVDSRTANDDAVEKEMECRWGGANDCTVVVKAAMMARRTSKLLLLLQLRTVSVMVSLSLMLQRSGAERYEVWYPTSVTTFQYHAGKYCPPWK
jgi:hypothetical protein